MNTYEVVTLKIVELLKNNENPWTKPWVTQGLMRQKNLSSGRAYTGLNALILALADRKYDYWLSFKDANEIGLKIRRGEKATKVIGWFRSSKEVENDDGEIETKHGGLACRFFNVFNLDQFENVPDSLLKKASRPESITFSTSLDETAEKLIEETKANISFGHEVACYIPLLDKIKMPNRDRFEKPNEFYSTVFHELGHWTGHKSRLKRAEIGKSARFNSKAYSQEELCAEMSSVYICSALEISSESTLRNSAAYLKNWLKFLEANPKAFAIACQQAQKASDFILNIGEFYE